MEIKEILERHLTKRLVTGFQLREFNPLNLSSEMSAQVKRKRIEKGSGGSWGEVGYKYQHKLLQMQFK